MSSSRDRSYSIFMIYDRSCNLYIYILQCQSDKFCLHVPILLCFYTCIRWNTAALIFFKPFRKPQIPSNPPECEIVQCSQMNKRLQNINYTVHYVFYLYICKVVNMCMKTSCRTLEVHPYTYVQAPFFTALSCSPFGLSCVRCAFCKSLFTVKSRVGRVIKTRFEIAVAGN